MKTKPMPHGAWPLLLSRDQAAEFLNISGSTFDKHVRTNLTEKRIGKRVLWDRREIENHFEDDPISEAEADRETIKKIALAQL